MISAGVNVYCIDRLSFHALLLLCMYNYIIIATALYLHALAVVFLCCCVDGAECDREFSAPDGQGVRTETREIQRLNRNSQTTGDGVGQKKVFHIMKYLAGV